MKLKKEDLQPGMVWANHGIITDIDDFGVWWLDYNDAGAGACCSTKEPEYYKISESLDLRLTVYDIVLYQLDETINGLKQLANKVQGFRDEITAKHKSELKEP